MKRNMRGNEGGTGGEGNGEWREGEMGEEWNNGMEGVKGSGRGRRELHLIRRTQYVLEGLAGPPTTNHCK